MNIAATGGEEYCRQKAAATGTNFYYSTLYYPADRKRDLFALHAFANEIEQIPEECSDPGVARMKLAWWQEEIQRLHGNAARHPVTRELASLINCQRLPVDLLVTFIRHHDGRLNPGRLDTRQSLMDFLAQGPGVLWRYTAVMCGARDPATPDIVSRMGAAFATFYLLQNKRTQGHLLPYFPADHMNTVRLLQEVVADLEHGCQAIPPPDRAAQLCAMILARIIIATCEEIADDGYRIEEQGTSLTPLRKLWIAWRTRRKALSTKS